VAVGDIAASAGLDLVSGSDAANTLDTELNKILDLIGTIILNNQRKTTVSPTAPSSPVVGDVWIKTS
jgi:hypothetical protein